MESIKDSRSATAGPDSVVRTWCNSESACSNDGAVSVVISARSISFGIPERIFWSRIFRVGEFICCITSGFLPVVILDRDMDVRSRESCPAESRAYSFVALSGDEAPVLFLFDRSEIAFSLSSAGSSVFVATGKQLSL